MGELQTSTTDEKAFLRLAVAAIPRVSEPNFTRVCA